MFKRVNIYPYLHIFQRRNISIPADSGGGGWGVEKSASEYYMYISPLKRQK